MLAKAHIAAGMAAAFTVMMPGSVPEALPVIAGASAGCLICDIDCDNVNEKRDSSRWRLVAMLVAAAALFEDYLLDAGMVRSLSERNPYIWFSGIAGFILICTFASVSAHRGFSHSLPALALESFCVWLVFPAMTEPFAIAFISHVILDLMNKRPVQIFYPAKKGLRLGWFYADRLANKVVSVAGTVWLIIVIAACLRK